MTYKRAGTEAGPYETTVRTGVGPDHPVGATLAVARFPDSQIFRATARVDDSETEGIGAAI